MSSTPRNIPLAVVGTEPASLEPGARQVARLGRVRRLGPAVGDVAE
jgi:hypothetical protein